MGDMAEVFNDMKDRRRKLRAAFGVPCAMCIAKQPKRNPSILLPGQFCKVDGFMDKRPKLTYEQKRSVNAIRNS